MRIEGKKVYKTLSWLLIKSVFPSPFPLTFRPQGQRGWDRLPGGCPRTQITENPSSLRRATGHRPCCSPSTNTAPWPPHARSCLVQIERKHTGNPGYSLSPLKIVTATVTLPRAFSPNQDHSHVRYQQNPSCPHTLGSEPFNNMTASCFIYYTAPALSLHSLCVSWCPGSNPGEWSKSVRPSLP